MSSFHFVCVEVLNIAPTDLAQKKTKTKKNFSNKNNKEIKRVDRLFLEVQDQRHAVKNSSMMSHGKLQLLKRQSLHGEPNRAGKDEWHPKRWVIMDCGFHISSKYFWNPNCSKDSCRSNHGVRYYTSTGLNGATKLVKAITNIVVFMQKVVLNLIPGADVSQTLANSQRYVLHLILMQCILPAVFSK